KFSETYSEKLVSVTEDGYRTYYVVPSDSGSFSSSILVAGLSQAQVGPDTELSFSLGNYEFEDIVDDADASTANSATFYQMYEDDAGRNHKIGQITFARGGNTLKVSGASSSLPDASPIAQEFIDTQGKISGEIPLVIHASNPDGDLATIERTLYYKGTST